MLKRNFIAAGMLAGLMAPLVAPLMASVAAQAQPGPGFHGGFHHESLLEGVTLTDAQQTQVHALRKASWQATRPIMQQLHAVQEQIDSALLSSGTVTEANLAPLVQQKESLMQQLDAQHVSEQIAVRNLLTADQIAQASTSHAKLEALHAQEMTLRRQNAPAGAPAGVPPADAE